MQLLFVKLYSHSLLILKEALSSDSKKVLRCVLDSFREDLYQETSAEQVTQTYKTVQEVSDQAKLGLDASTR